jgi:hypothetical protein
MGQILRDECAIDVIAHFTAYTRLHPKAGERRRCIGGAATRIHEEVFGSD